MEGGNEAIPESTGAVRGGGRARPVRGCAGWRRNEAAGGVEVSYGAQLRRRGGEGKEGGRRREALVAARARQG